jgi:hypothetical protein
MTTSIITSLQHDYPVSQSHQNFRSLSCRLQWRRGQLLVKSSEHSKQPDLPALDNKRLLVDCLKHSPAKLVSIDPNLGVAMVQFWADACQEANKPIFLSLPAGQKLPKPGNRLLRVCQRVIDWMLALVLLVVLSPVMLGLMMLLQIYSPGQLFSYQWHVGARGKLFRAFQFCISAKIQLHPLGFLLRQYGLAHLPKLFNVLRGEMSFLANYSASWEEMSKSFLPTENQPNKLPVKRVNLKSKI